MDAIQESNRRVEISADISDFVYTYENDYAAGLPPLENVNKELSEAGYGGTLEIVDSMYDEKTGVAAIAVYDDDTKETYIAYAGTNYDADGTKDIITDMAIGLNDSLYLKEMSKPAVDFYERVEAKGNSITMTTGHSYGEFLAGRVALEKQVIYNYGYQGAPQSVNGQTAQEMLTSGGSGLFDIIYNSKNYEEFERSIKHFANGPNYKIKLPSDKELKEYWDYFERLKMTSPEKVEAAKAEAARVTKLQKNYHGQSITFSSTRDVLTNIAWEQGKGELSFGGQVLSGNIGESLLDAATPGLMKFLGISKDTVYPEKVVAIDVPIEHNMTKYRTSEEALLYTKQTVLAQMFGVDLDGDGTLEFAVTPENTTTRDLIPKRGGSQKIALDTASMAALVANLKVCLSQAQELEKLAQQTIAANENVMNGLSNRRNNLKDAVVQHLESISLIEAVQKIDTAYSNYGSITGTFNTLNAYDPQEFSRKFDWFGTSGLYDYLDAEDNPFNHGAITASLTSMKSKNESLVLDINLHKLAEGGKSDGKLWPQDAMYTKMGTKGQELVNSFENMIEKSTSGLANRAHFADGIPDAVNEILKVLLQNIQTIISCIQYTFSVAGMIKAALEETDNGLARNIDSLDFSSVPTVDTSVSQDYNTYLEESGIFDDRDVISAFDDQIDVKASELANQMSSAFSGYLASVRAAITETNTVMTTAKSNLQSVKDEFPTQIFYKVKFEDKKKKQLYGTVEQQISIASTIRTAITDIDSVDLDLTTAITTINLAVSMLGGFYQPFRNGMEDAFYGATNLQGIVRSQKAIGAVLSSLNTRFTNFKSDLAGFGSGAAVDALGYKLGDMTNLMGNVTKVIDDCFGD
ncbi:hypothetical protein STRDD11_01355 [Streptococcus sp. DD11]|uniref:SA1320 family protein n=1 Tax=Streptococcus sp. DD11 TaxID=1777879 RepID=UPI0007999057|nr:hypothetical protein [Streptococcus sp. DD11]KXT83686.1 hypothetical protein STRDD11_01355 [Streptococcus sp. DD11]